MSKKTSITDTTACRACNSAKKESITYIFLKTFKFFSSQLTCGEAEKNCLYLLNKSHPEVLSRFYRQIISIFLHFCKCWTEPEIRFWNVVTSQKLYSYSVMHNKNGSKHVRMYFIFKFRTEVVVLKNFIKLIGEHLQWNTFLLQLKDASF